MFIAGIDPGMSGAIVVIKNIVQSVGIECLPFKTIGKGETDLNEAAQFLRENQPDHAVVEKVHAMPKQGVTSTFSFGKSYGAILGMLTALQIPYVLVRPQEWKAQVLKGSEWKGNKKASIIYALRKYPTFSLKRTERSRVNDHNIADALCLAEYGRMINR